MKEGEKKNISIQLKYVLNNESIKSIFKAVSVFMYK